MALEVAQLLRQTFVTSLEEIGPKLPTRFSNQFQRIKDCITDEHECTRNLWSSTSACAALLPYLYNLNDALADCRSFVEELTQNLSILNPVQRIYFARDMKTRLESIKNNLAESVAEYRVLTSSGMTNYPTGRHTSFGSNASQDLDFGEQEKQIEALLADKGYEAIGIYGINSSGNTALIQKVLKSPRFYKEFSPIIWVCLSNMRSEEDEDMDDEIVKYMLCELGSDVDKWTTINLSKRVLLENLKKLLTSQKYLIVFDDIWQINYTIGINRLSDALPRDGGGKIIITSELKEVVKKMVGVKNLIHLKPMNRGLEPIFGFGEQEQEIDALISDNGYKAIGVYGMSGSGKTALIQKVLNSSSVYDAFSPIIWVCLSDINSKDDGDIEVKIVKYILCKLGSDADRWINPGNIELLEILKKSLMSKKYLIVFDDVLEIKNFYANLGDTSSVTDTVVNRLSNALPRDGDGKIIVTSRLREVAEKMVGQKNLIHMKPLNRESCRLILEAGIGFLEYATEIESLLKYSGFVAIGIYGSSNSARTALIHKVLSSASVGGMFKPILWLCDSQISSREEVVIRSEILKCMLQDLVVNKDELMRADTDFELLEIVKRSLLSKKYLIVMADLGNKNQYRAYWIWLFNELSQYGDGTVIVTSATKEVAQEMVGENNLIHVRLPELAANETSEVTIHRQYVTDEIVDQCHGHPLAAKTLAKIIREKGHES